MVFIPKYRKKAIFNNLRNILGERFREFAAQKESEILEGHVMQDHVHMLICIPPKYSVSQVVGYIKGKSAIWIARNYFGRQQNYTGQHFWARGFYVSTVGRDEKVIAEYIRNQERWIYRRTASLGWGSEVDCVCQVLQKHFSWHRLNLTDGNGSSFRRKEKRFRRNRRRRKIMRLSWKMAPIPSGEAASGAPSARPCQDT